MAFRGINHVGLIVTNADKANHFLREILGLQQHPKRSSWYMVGHCTIHIIEISDASVDSSIYHDIQHVALEVDDLRDVLPRLVKASLAPFQMDFDGNKKPLETADADLSFGIGTIFVKDPDGNLFEFIQIGHGAFANEIDPFRA